MRAILIDMSRDSLTLGRVADTMTVGELMGILDGFDPEQPIYTAMPNHEAFGGLTYERIDEIEL